MSSLHPKFIGGSLLRAAMLAVIALGTTATASAQSTRASEIIPRRGPFTVPAQSNIVKSQPSTIINAISLVVVDDDWTGYSNGTIVTVGANNYTIGTDAFADVPAGIAAVDPLGTVQVLAGTYTGGVLGVNKTITLQGAQSGVDARTRAGSESVLQYSGGLHVTMSDVIVDGFTIENSTSGAFTGSGILLGSGTSGAHVVNNIIQNNIIGIGLFNAGPSQAVIQYNLIQNNNQTGPASGSGMYTDEYYGLTGTTNVLIDNNTFIGNDNAGVGISVSDPTKSATLLEITNNRFENTGRGAYFISTKNSSVKGNVFNNMTVPTDGGSSRGIGIWGAVDGLTIEDNQLTTGALRGIQVADFIPPNPNMNVEIHNNDITGFPLYGLAIDAPADYVGTLDAECNWWGHISGPTALSNPGGTGSIVLGNVDFDSWLDGSITGSPNCTVPVELSRFSID